MNGRSAPWTALLCLCLSCVLAHVASAEPLPLNGTQAPHEGTWFEHKGKSLKAGPIPSGKASIGGVEWRIDPSAGWLLKGSARKPAGTLGLPEGTRATHLMFLHTFDPGRSLHEWRLAAALAHRKLVPPPEPPTVCLYEVTYADGEVLEIPVRFGESIDQWYRVHRVAPMLWARPAWQQDLHPTSGEKAVLYAMEWPNPRPEKAIQSVALKPQPDPAADYGTALALGLTALNSPPAGRYYYVATFPDGSDENPGTFEKPFASLQEAADVAGAGDTVFVRGGLYGVERRIEIQGSGAPDRWLTFTAYPGETPVFDGMASRLDRDAETHGHGYDHDTGLISAFERSYVRIAGLHVQRSRRAGFGLFGKRGRGSRATGHEVLFCSTWRTWAMGVNIKHADHVRVIGNRIVRPHDHTMFYGYEENRAIAARAGPQEAIDLSRNTHFEVAFNEVYGGGKEAIDCISVTDGRIHHNYVHHCLNGIYIDSWTLPIERLEIDHNYIHNAYNGIPLSTEGSNDLVDFKIHHNIVIDSKAIGIGVSEATYKSKPAAVRDISVYNNTVDGGGGHASGIGWTSSGLRVHGHPENPDFRDIFIFNNISTNADQVPASCSYEDREEHNIRFHHNLLYPAENRAPDRVRRRNENYKVSHALVTGEHSVTARPMYVNRERGDYRLREGSPAIDAGDPREKFNDPDGSRADVGALPHGAAWRQGFDWAGAVTAFYAGDTAYEPVDIPRELFNVHANSLETPSWFQAGRYGADLRHLPKGEQSYAGIIWYLEPDRPTSEPTLLVLKGTGSESEAGSITVPVGRQADALAFLHAYSPGPDLRKLWRDEEVEDKSVRLLTYRVNYADGTSREVPVRWDIEIQGWRRWRKPENLPGARVAWKMPERRRRHTGWIVVYAQEWENPRPAAEIATVELGSANTDEKDYGAPAVLAISTGHRAAARR